MVPEWKKSCRNDKKKRSFLQERFFVKEGRRFSVAQGRASTGWKSVGKA